MRMRVGVYFNANYIDVNRAHIDTISARLCNSNIDCIIVDNLEKLYGLDILIVLGGDGTILTVASKCAEYGIKIIGINYGHLGFLAEFEPNQLSEAIEMICSGNFATEKRSMLQITHSNGKEYFALNDAVIQRSTSGDSFSNTISLHAEIDGSTVDNISSDGLIISTPTGSTAYSLAAGGSVLTPDIGALIMTPICAHSLHSRPIVFSDKSKVVISRTDNRGVLNCIVDGKAVQTIAQNDTITIKKAHLFVEFITSPEKNFFDKLLYKLNVWGK